MFKKTFKQKSQISLKSSDKKKFVADLRTLFPTLTDEDINIINGYKENLIKIKVTTIKEELVEIYAFEKVPLLFDLIQVGVKLPTVFMCWKFPHIVPNISTESFVLSKLQNGADLFGPGIIIQGLASDTTDFKTNDPVCINLPTNKAAMAVGLSLVNKEDILSSNSDHHLGKVVKIYHIVGDFLYKIHPEPIIPEMGLPDWAQATSSKPCLDNEDELHDSDKQEENTSNTTQPGPESEKESLVENNDDAEKSGEELEKEKLNEILEYCFIKALKKVPKTSYPVLPATFYANYVLTSLPEGGELNIKKTKWKKFSVFLQEKSLQGLIKLQPIQRGEFTIAGADHDHKLIKEFVDIHEDKPVQAEAVSKTEKPSMLQVFAVSAAVEPFFSNFGLSKNSEITRTNVRLHLNDYVKKNNLIHPENMEKVKLDPLLYNIIKGEEVITRVELLEKMLEKMSIRYKISSTPNVVHKGKMPVIIFELFMRNKNKKVTLISNLESYGVNVVNFSRELQQKAAASTTIVSATVPDKKGPQVQVQGNQILIAANILKEKYNINEKFMRGLEKAPKAKKNAK